MVMTQQTRITIQGMYCESCNALIEEVCLELPGVKRCAADFKTGIAILEHDKAFDAEKLREEIQSLGPYQVLEIRGEISQDKPLEL